MVPDRLVGREKHGMSKLRKQYSLASIDGLHWSPRLTLKDTGTVAGGKAQNLHDSLAVIMHKRKHRKSVRDDDWEQSAHATGTSHVQSSPSTENPDSTAPNPCLYIQAYEADVIRGQRTETAQTLECQDASRMMTTSNNSKSGLIRWGPPERSGDRDTVDTEKLNHPLLWVDR